MQRLITTNWLAIVVNLIAHFALGMAWYGALATPWMEAIEAKTRGFDPQTAPPIIYLTTVIVVPLATLFIAKLMELANERSIADGVKWGLLLWALVILPMLLMHYAFAGNSLLLTAIDGGFELASLTLTGVTLGALGFRTRGVLAARSVPATA